MNIKIKKLEWQRFGETGQISNTNFGSYCVWRTYNGVVSYSTFDRSKTQHEYISLAEEYCQQDFEKRILGNII